MEMNSGPHQSSRGNRLASMKPTIIRSAGDQESIGPIGVRDQSKARMRAPISPPPANHETAGFTSEGAELGIVVGPEPWILDVPTNYWAEVLTGE